MHVGVTGSSGFIGTALVEALEERGDSVTRFVRPGSTHSRSVVHWDPARGLVDEADLKTAGGFDAVVNLAGTGIADKRWNPSRKSEILTSRTSSTSLLVETLSSLRSPPAVLASGSAIGVYGLRGDDVLDEVSEHGTDFLAVVCEQWEAAALALHESGTRVVLLRTGIVLNRRGGTLKRQIPLFQFGLGGALGSGEQWLSPISLTDEVRAILWTIDHAIEGPVNLTSPKPLTNREFTKVLAHEMHRPALFRVPKLGLYIVLGKDLTSNAVLASQRVVPKVLTESGFSFHDADIASIVHDALEN